MILEFTGLSGAGKTTAEPCIISGLEQRGYEVFLQPELKNSYIKKKICPYYENHPGFRILSNRLYNLGSWNALRGANLAGEIIRGALSRRRRKSFLWLGEDIKLSNYFAHEFKPPGGRPGVYLSQEGFVHHIACCKLHGDNSFSGLSQKLLNKLPADKILIVYFRISVDEVLDRLLKRGLPESWPRSINSRSSVKEYLLRFNDAIEDGVAKFQASGVKVRSIDAALDLKQVESQITALLDVFPQNGYTERVGNFAENEKNSKENKRLQFD